MVRRRALLLVRRVPDELQENVDQVGVRRTSSLKNMEGNLGSKGLWIAAALRSQQQKAPGARLERLASGVCRDQPRTRSR